MRFNISFDQALNSLPTGFVTAVNYVTSYFSHLFTDNITINIHVGYGEVNGQTLGSSALGSSLTFLNSFSYASIRSALAADAKSPDDNTSVASLPVGDPIGSPHAYWLSIAEQRALGLRASVDGQIDGYVGFSSTFNFDYNRNDGITAGFYDFIGVVEHEFSEVMGRVVLAGQSIGGGPGFEPLDLFDYSSAGVRRLIGTNPGYFSIDGGVTNLDNFNTNPGGDFGDWAASAGNDAGLAFSSSGVLNNYGSVDVRSLDVLGYNRAPATSHDFSGDGLSDILWRNTSTGGVAMWEMNGAQVATTAALGGDPNWTIAATGDFNGDGMSDILWRNPNTGGVVMWEMNGTQVATTATLGGDPSWAIAGTGDFNGDGMSDILWRNTSTGGVVMWEMNGTQVATTAGLGGDPSWAIAGTGDFNGDGKSDILLRNTNTGGVVMWEMNGTQIATAAGLGGDPSWAIAGTGDFNGDGKSDILWRNPSTGGVVMWEMNGTQIATIAALGGGPSWDIGGTSDFNGDGMSDILWRNPSSSGVVMWEMNGTQVATTATLGGDPNWKPVAV